jgi:hypothetical protein
MPSLRQSSFLIVPVPLLTEMVALVGDDRFRKNVSFASWTASPFTRTVTNFVVSFGAKVSVVNASAV